MKLLIFKNFKKKENNYKGQSLIEIIIALAIGVIFIGAAVGAVALSLRSNLDTRTTQTADNLARELVDNVSVIAESDWIKIYNLTKTSNYYIDSSRQIVSAGPSDETIIIENRSYKRYFFVENVNRDSCGIGDITSNSISAPDCIMQQGVGYIAEDPSTQKITAKVEWGDGRSMSVLKYISKTRNFSFTQTDWAGGSQTQFGVNGALVSNIIGSDIEIIYDIAVSDLIYPVGSQMNASVKYLWRMEGRDISDGGLIWAQTVDPNPSLYDEPWAVVIDSDYMYVAGYDKITTNTEWRIEKRRLTDGSLTGGWQQVSNPTGFNDYLYAITQDSAYLYLAGSDGPNFNHQWRIEKRRKSDGDLERSVVFDLSGNDDEATSIIVDGSYIYVGGYDKTLGGNNARWRVERRMTSDLSLDTSWAASGIWLRGEDLTVNDDMIEGLAIDSGGLYAGGNKKPTLTDGAWHIVKINPTGNGIIWEAESNPASFGGALGGEDDQLKDIAIDSSGIYAVGYDNYPRNNNPSNDDYQWRVEKRNLANGNLIWEQTDNQSPSNEKALAVAVDSTAVYAAGYEMIDSTYAGWRIEKRDLDTGFLVYPKVTSKPLNIFATSSITMNYQSSASGGASLEIINPAVNNSADLTSIIFDVSKNDGGSLNTVMWQGALNNGTVKFQIASSDCSNGATNPPVCDSGDWSFIGPDGTNISYYIPLTSGDPLELNPKYHSNARFFRYKIILEASPAFLSPIVDDVIINYSL
ncbi:MAG: prepilin-type N-terminal cleavage/methylation domain-containing protein [Patescibacteria group bacterium]